MGGSISALAIGVNADAMAGELSGVDLTEVITINHDLVSSYNADGYSDVVSQVIKSESPKTIVAGHSYQTRDFMPRVSAKLDIPFIPDIISMDDGIVKQVLNAKLNALVTTSADQVILSFQSAMFSEEAMVTGSCLARSIEVNLDSSIVRSEAEDPFQEDAGDVDLESAELIVSIGRGIEKEENISMAFDLAKVLGAEVSASRPVVDSDWVESFRQVGSSGQTVAPKLYFSLGISGAIQHVVGMKGSKNILAINKDPDAPIFEIADYAVVGDLLDIIPKLIEALQTEKDL
jgi:electron transfer flavoprotein alpha subunit